MKASGVRSNSFSMSSANRKRGNESPQCAVCFANTASTWLPSHSSRSNPDTPRPFLRSDNQRFPDFGTFGRQSKWDIRRTGMSLENAVYLSDRSLKIDVLSVTSNPSFRRRCFGASCLATAVRFRFRQIPVLDLKTRPDDSTRQSWRMAGRS